MKIRKHGASHEIQNLFDHLFFLSIFISFFKFFISRFRTAAFNFNLGTVSGFTFRCGWSNPDNKKFHFVSIVLVFVTRIKATVPYSNFEASKNMTSAIFGSFFSFNPLHCGMLRISISN